MRTLLIVDDEDGIRSLVRMTLDSDTYQIIEACEGRQALELAREHHPDLVLLDVMLPDLDGLEVTRPSLEDIYLSLTGPPAGQPVPAGTREGRAR